MLGLLPAIFVLAAMCALATMRERRGPFGRGARETLLVAIIIAGGWGVAGAELLGLAHSIDRASLIAWWLIPISMFVAIAWLRRRTLCAWVERHGAWDWPTGAIVSVTGVIVVAAFIVAWPARSVPGPDETL